MKPTLFLHLTKLNKNIHYNNVITRNMLTLTSGSMSATLVQISKSALSKLPKASMSCYSLHDAEKIPKDPLALKKNPPIGKKGYKHKEIRKTNCTKEECDKKVCTPSKPCGPLKNHKTIGNTTHGNKDTSYGTNHNLDPSIDYNGDPKPQNAIFYQKAHDAHLSPEDPKGSVFLNKPNVIHEIQKYEDKS